MKSSAQIILVRRDGAVILQQRDDKPGITNPGLVTAFGGEVEPGEQPLEAAVREINEETNLDLHTDDLEFFEKYRKTQAVHGEGREVYYFVARNIDDQNLKVYEGQGFVIIHHETELAQHKTSILAREVLTDYFRGLQQKTTN